MLRPQDTATRERGAVPSRPCRPPALTVATIDELDEGRVEFSTFLVAGSDDGLRSYHLTDLAQQERTPMPPRADTVVFPLPRPPLKTIVQGRFIDQY